MVKEGRKYKLKQFAQMSYILLVLFGLFLGPSSWYLSHDFQSQYNAFAQDAIETKGTVYKRSLKSRGKVSSCYIAVRYSRKMYSISLASKVEVRHALEVKKGDVVIVLYHPEKPDNEIRIKGELDWKNLPPILKPYIGIVYTFFSYLSLIYFLIRGHRNKKRKLKAKGLFPLD